VLCRQQSVVQTAVCCADSCSLFSDWAVKTEQNQNTQGVYKEETTSKIRSITITGK